MKDKLLEDLYASYNGDAYATQLEGLVEKYGDIQVAEMILNQFEDSQKPAGRTDVIEFQSNYHLFWNNLKLEFDKLVCGESTYKSENQDYYTMGRFYSLATASAMASTLQPILNIPVYILTPTIALMLHSMFKIGRNAYCSTVKL